MTNHAMMVQTHSQCEGQGFDPPLLHHLFSSIYGCRYWRPYFICGQFVDTFLGTQFYRFNGSAFRFFNRSHVTHSHANIGVAEELSDRKSITSSLGQASAESRSEILPN